MADDDYEENEFPIAYLITFRTYGTWLHGDERGSIRRIRKSRGFTKVIDINIPLKERMNEQLDGAPVVLDTRQRKAVQTSIKELCKERGYILYALNVRSNHVHAVIGVKAKPERIADALKAFATKKLRELGLAGPDERIWSRGRSRRYLWKPRHVSSAIDYVLYCQSDVPFELDD
jgi:REP element-mobilizing transposase RayT